MNRTGIFLCTCDGKIDKGVDVRAVAAALAPSGRVSIQPHLCLPDGMRGLSEEIIERGVERVVLAACPARFQEKRLTEACIEAGINPNQVALVDWREGCAWAHRGDREGATAQALDLVRMGMARVENARPLDGVMAHIVPHALVIGGGAAGLAAARALADKGIGVTLVERRASLGGRRAASPDSPRAALDNLIGAVTGQPRIEVLVNSRVAAVEGGPGDYRVKVTGLEGMREVHAGVVVVAIGAQERTDPTLYRYDGRRVVTLAEFEEQLPESTARSLVYLLCAGSRDESIPYCSATCCLDSLKQALRDKRAHPNARVTILFRDLYLLGDELNEDVVREARRAGVEFIRYAAGRPPRVEDEVVVVTDTQGTAHRLPYDRVILATALVPPDDAGVLARLLHLPRDEHDFFIDPHFRVRPEEQRDRGIFICGSAHRPVDGDTAMLQGMTAAARAARFIKKREIMRPSSSATVSAPICTGCAQCVSTCHFSAIHMLPGRTNGGAEGVLDRASIDPFLCQECGNCVVACPSKAIDLPSWSDAQILGQIDATLSGADSPEPRVLAFACRWSGFAAMELAGARKQKWSAGVRTVELPCSARLDPMHVLYALLNGAEKVLVALCPPDECHFGSGNQYAEARIETLRAQMAAHGIDPERLVIVELMGDDSAAWVKAVERVA